MNDMENIIESIVPGTPGEWELSTADTYIRIASSDDGPVIRELKNPKQNYNWIYPETTVPLPDNIYIEGKQKSGITWTYANFKIDDMNGKKISLVFQCNEFPQVSVTSIWQADTNNPGPIQHQFVFDNKSNRNAAIYPLLRSLELDVKSDGDVNLWRFNKDQCPIDPVGVYINKLAGGSSYTVSAFDNTEGGGFLPFAVLDCGEQHGMYTGWEWQIGNVNVTAGSANAFKIKTGYDDGANDGMNGPDFVDDCYELMAKTSFAMPFSYLGTYKGDVDEGTNLFKRWYFHNKIPSNLRNDPTEPWTQFGGMFYYFDPDVPDYIDGNGDGQYYFWASSEASVEKALTDNSENSLKSIGFECLEIDYGWFGPDNSPLSFDSSPVLFPKGMRNISDMARANGFKFHLYFANLVNRNTKETLADRYAKYNLDCWRSDFGRPDIGALDWLAENIPNYRYETCNGGGRNKDFATYSYATVGTVTDDVYPLGIRQAFYVSSYVLPPAQLSQCNHIGYISPGKKAVLNETTDEFTYCLRSGMLGALFPAICACGPVYNPANIVVPGDEPLTAPIYKKNVAIYKESLRPLIREANIYHILPRPDGINWDGIEYYDSMTREGAIMLYKPSISGGENNNIILKGLEPSQTYSFEFTDRPEQNITMTGAELMKNGLPVIMTGELTSEIILFERYLL